MVEGRLLTYQTLLEHGACSDYRIPFEKLFQESVLVTVELAVAQALDWSWTWAAEELLSPKGRAAYDAIAHPAEDEYRAVMAPLWRAESETVDKARDAYRRAEQDYKASHGGVMDYEGWDAADAAYNAVMAPALEAQKVAQGPARLKMQQTRARAFAELYIKEGNEK